MQRRAFNNELTRLRTEFDRLQVEHAWRHGRTDAEERDHLDRFHRWITDVEVFRRTYLVYRER